MNIEEAIKQSFMLFSGNYGKLWDPTNNTVAAWLLIVGDDNPMDVLKASLEWCRSDSKYPPTAGQIHRKIPANCRCGDCIRCNSRALARRIEISNRRDSNDWRSILPPRPTPQLEENNDVRG